MTVVPGFTTTSFPSIVAVKNPGFFGGGGGGGPAGFGGAAADAAGLISSAIGVAPYVSWVGSAPLLLHLAGDVVDAVVDRDQIGEEAPLRHGRQRHEHRPDRRAQSDLVGPSAAVGDEIEPE